MGGLEPRLDHLARELAIVAHAGATRRGGEAYIRHVFRVAAGVGPLGQEAVAVAYLHDVLEDTAIKSTTLFQLFPETVVVPVIYLTRRVDHETYDCYIDELVADGPDVALQVKLSDLADHKRCGSDRKRYARADAAIRAELKARGAPPLQFGSEW